MHHSVVGAVMVLFAVGLLAGCGESTKQTQGVSAYRTNGEGTATVSIHIPPSKREIAQSRVCLERERVRPARRISSRQEVPHGANEVTRNGLPMTPQEYEATVRKCLSSTKSGSASAGRK